MIIQMLSGLDMLVQIQISRSLVEFMLYKARKTYEVFFINGAGEGNLNLMYFTGANKPINAKLIKYTLVNVKCS